MFAKLTALFRRRRDPLSEDAVKHARVLLSYLAADIDAMDTFSDNPERFRHYLSTAYIHIYSVNAVLDGGEPAPIDACHD